jgi:thiaminase/transcriptional activator TenA
MKWSDKAWEECASVYEKILELPFLNELMNGTLPQEKFHFYLQQDAIYLAEYGKILAGVAAKLDRKEWREDFLKFSSDTVVVEQALHEHYLKNSAKAIQATPTCALYTGHMYRHLASSSVEETLASVLPCFWVYKKMGDYILENQTENQNPYQPWIDTYGGEDFALAVQKAIDICDEAAKETTPARQESMIRTFKLSFKMEWMFWDSAWRLEQWLV